MAAESQAAREAGVAEGEPTWRYVRLGELHVLEDMPLPGLVALLWDHHVQVLADEGKKITRVEGWRRWLPPVALKALRVGRLAWRFARARRGADASAVLELPVRGDVAVVRRSGAIKVFAMREDRAITVMRDPHDADKLRSRIASARSVEHFPFAPKVLDVDLGRGTFSETLLRGSRPTNFRGCFEGFEANYLGLLVHFLLAEPPQPSSLRDYAASLSADILDPSGLTPQLAPSEQARLRRRVEKSIAALGGGDATVPLVLSHGDFFSGNIVVSRTCAAAIDWAHVGRRSPLHDLYYLVMNHCVRVLEPPALANRFTEMLSMLRQRLQEADPDRMASLDPWLSSGSGPRHLFYLECIQVPLVRCDRADDRYIKAMLQRVAWFDAFEASLAPSEEDASRA